MDSFGKERRLEALGAGDRFILHADPRGGANFIRLFDKFGQEFFIAKEKWRADILPRTIQSHWNDPNSCTGSSEWL
jgi:hypothetical protein